MKDRYSSVWYQVYGDDAKKKRTAWKLKRNDEKRAEILMQKIRTKESRELRKIAKCGEKPNYAKDLRKKVIDLYGGKCDCCGEAEYSFLALDHIRGAKRRVKGKYKSYLDALVYDPSEYRILCHNCNMATKNGATCPHKIGV